jgi:hypothetical protein
MGTNFATARQNWSIVMSNPDCVPLPARIKLSYPMRISVIRRTPAAAQADRSLEAMDLEGSIRTVCRDLRIKNTPNRPIRHHGHQDLPRLAELLLDISSLVNPTSWEMDSSLKITRQRAAK